jgi:uncharacterized protein YbjT (DUF2867 family)
VAKTLQALGVETRNVDLDRAEMEGLTPIIDAMHGAHRVFLLSGYEVKMLSQSKAAIDAATAVGATHMVHIGANARPNTTTTYSGWHQMIEAYIERSGLTYTHIHPNSFMQNLPMFLAMGRGGPGVIEYFTGSAPIGWSDAEDVAAVAAAALRDPEQHAGQTYSLSSDVATMDDVAALIGEATNSPWRYQALEPEVFFERITGMGADAYYMAGVRNGFIRTIDGALPELSEVYDNIRALTSREPSTLRNYINRNRGAFTAFSVQAGQVGTA